jgi:hypothetical protein
MEHMMLDSREKTNVKEQREGGREGGREGEYIDRYHVLGHQQVVVQSVLLLRRWVVTEYP